MTREVQVNNVTTVRYKWISYGRYGEWAAIAWKVLDGKWHGCESPRTSKRILGMYSHRKELPE